MRLAIDLRLIYDSPNFYLRGIGTYIKGLIPQLLNFSDKWKIVFILDKSLENFKKEYEYSNIQKVKLFPGISKKSLVFQGMILPFQLTFKYDLVHFLFHEIAPFSPFYRKYVVTVHDVIPIKFPQFSHQKGAKQKIFEMQNYMILKYAKKIITLSENTKKDIIEIFKIKEDKIKTIYPALTFNPEELKLDKQMVKKSFLKKFKWINNPFFLYVGGFDGRKNLLEIIKLFSKNKSFIQSDYIFVLVGHFSPLNAFGQLAEYIYLENLQEKIVFTGYLTQDELIKFYILAEVLIFPSLYEGFGFPVLEAMAMGLPVCALKNSSLPELLGENYPVYDSLEKLVTAAMDIVFSNSEKQNLSKLGRERSKFFTWKKFIREYLKVYENSI